MNYRSNFFKSCLVLVSLFLVGNNIFAQTSPSDIVHLMHINQGLQTPTRIAIDNADNIFVTDHLKRGIVQYGSSGNYIQTINTSFEPTSIAINSSNQLFVGGAGTIYKVESNGTLSVFYTGCLMPSSMTFSPDGLLYVVDSQQKIVFALNAVANVVKTFGLGDLIFPSSIAYDARNSRIFIGEHGGVGTGFNPPCKVWIYDLTGNQIGSFGANGNLDGKFYRIQGIAIGKCGNIYVNEPFQASVSVFDESLNFITKFGTFGDSLSQLNVPLDIAFDSQERIIVTSMNNSAVEVFEVNSILPTSNITNADAMICNGQTTDVLVHFTGVAPWTYTYALDGINKDTITTSTNPDTLRVSTPGIYEVTALSDISHTGTCFSGSAQITTTGATPSSNISIGNMAICKETTTEIPVNLTGTAPWTFTYTVSGANPKTIVTSTNPYIITTADTGVYEVINIADVGCTGSPTGASVVTINELPVATLSSTNLLLCEGQSTDLKIDLTGTAPWTFTYTLNGQDPIIVNTTSSTYNLPTTLAGTYAVTSLFDASCTNAANIGSIDVVVNPLPTATMVGVVSTICEGGIVPIPVPLTGTPPWNLSYTLDNVLMPQITAIYTNTYIIDATQSGVYAVSQVSDANCNGTVQSGNAVISVFPSPMANFTFSTNGFEISFINSSLNADTYFWGFGDGTTSTLPNPIYVYPIPGIYQVTLTASNLQCLDSIFTQTIDLSTVAVDQINTEGFVKIYPNPAKGIITMEIQNQTSENVSIEIVSALGQTIYTKQFNAQQIKEKIDLSENAKGVYFVKVVAGNLTKISKLVLFK